MSLLPVIILWSFWASLLATIPIKASWKVRRPVLYSRLVDLNATILWAIHFSNINIWSPNAGDVVRAMPWSG